MSGIHFHSTRSTFHDLADRPAPTAGSGAVCTCEPRVDALSPGFHSDFTETDRSSSVNEWKPGTRRSTRGSTKYRTRPSRVGAGRGKVVNVDRGSGSVPRPSDGHERAHRRRGAISRRPHDLLGDRQSDPQRQLVDVNPLGTSSRSASTRCTNRSTTPRPPGRLLRVQPGGLPQAVVAIRLTTRSARRSSRAARRVVEPKGLEGLLESNFENPGRC